MACSDSRPPYEGFLLKLVKLLVLAGSICALSAGPASAANFFVDDGAPDDTPPCVLADPCQNIQTAVVEARGSGGGDTITVAPGTYTEDVRMNNGADDGNTISGSGSGTGAGDTTIAGTNMNAAGAPCGTAAGPTPLGCVVQLGNLAGGIPSGLNLGLENVRISIGGATATDKAGVQAAGSGTTHLTNVVVAESNVANTAAGVFVGSFSPSMLLDRVQVLDPTATRTGHGINAATGFLLRDGNVQAGGGPGSRAINLPGQGSPSSTIQRSRLRHGFASTDPVIGGGAADLTIDSSVLVGGGFGVDLAAQSGIPRNLRVRNSTIDAGVPGVDNSASADAVRVTAGAVGENITATIRSSILFESVSAQQVAGTASVVCHDSDTRNDTQAAMGAAGAIACGTGVNNNTSTGVPGSLFSNAPAGDYTLAVGSAAIDTGAADALNAGPYSGESQTDLAGNGRVLRGKSTTCPGTRRDKGAFEAAAVTCPAPPVDPPATGGGDTGGGGGGAAAPVLPAVTPTPGKTTTPTTTPTKKKSVKCKKGYKKKTVTKGKRKTTKCVKVKKKKKK